MITYSKTAIEAIHKAFERFKAAALSDPSKAVIYTNGNHAKKDSIQLTPEQINGFMRCWTDDMTDPFYLARSQMSPNWYIADGVLITVSGTFNHIYWKKGLRSGKGQRTRIKHQIDLSDGRRIYLYLPIIYGLVTGKLDAPDSIKRQIAEQGLYAFYGNSYYTRLFEVHHIDGHAPYLGQPVPDYEEQNKEVQLLPTRLHSKMHAVNGKIITPSQDDIEGIEQLAQMGDDLPEEDGPYMIVEKDGKTQFASVENAFTAIDDDGSRIFAPKIKKDGQVVQSLFSFVANGQIYHLEV